MRQALLRTQQRVITVCWHIYVSTPVGDTLQMETDVISRSEGTFIEQMNKSLSVCVLLCVTYLFYSCYVTLLTPLYVRPLHPNFKL